MFNILIYSDNHHYGQYLKSLVSQAGQIEDIKVQTIRQLNKELMSLAGLIVVETDTGKELPDISRASSDLSVLIIASKDNKIRSGPDLEIFSKPLNGTRFVDSVYRWVKQQGLCKEGFSPHEPYLIGNNPKILELRKKINKLSDSDINVLICGQTGTGKGVLAQAIHNNSLRKSKPFVALNCANVLSNLLESELFGYKRGAFTGAWTNKTGMFELAGEGTIFLDEISEMSPSMQAKLLHVLQEKEFYPVGGHENVQVLARTIAATNADLSLALGEGRFRRDLYYRLAVIRLDLPLLKDRPEDIPVLAQFFLDKFCGLYNKNSSGLSEELLYLFKAYDWPGNVRELESTIKSLVAVDNEGTIRKGLLNKLSGRSVQETKKNPSWKPDVDQILRHNLSLKEVTKRAASQAEAELIARALRRAGGRKKVVASDLGVSYKCLLKKIKNYGM